MNDSTTVAARGLEAREFLLVDVVVLWVCPFAGAVANPRVANAVPNRSNVFIFS